MWLIPRAQIYSATLDASAKLKPACNCNLYVEDGVLLTSMPLFPALFRARQFCRHNLTLVAQFTGDGASSNAVMEEVLLRCRLHSDHRRPCITYAFNVSPLQAGCRA